MSRHCFFNGKIVPLSKASISLFDIGLLRGFGLFEAMRTYSREPFHLNDHLARLKSAAARFNIKIPLSERAIARVIEALVTKNIPKSKEANIRILLTGGRAFRMIEHDPNKPTFYILAEEYQPFPASYYEKGRSLIVEEFERQFPECKTTNYIEAVLLQDKIKKAGALEVLYVSNGFVRECSTSNIFVVKRGVLATPEKEILHGITRKVVIREARRAGISVRERNVSVKELYAADEVLITSSFKEVVPVVKIGTRRIGNGKVGPVTKRAMELFRAATP